MDHLRRLGNEFLVQIQPGEGGLTGRECPNPDCEGYFRVEFGTGLVGEHLPCHCPYCGHTAPHNQFWTKAQIEYAQSIVMRQITEAMIKDLKTLEFEHKPEGLFGIGISLTFEQGSSIPIRYYREDQLETEIICSSCTLRYAVYGVFAFCPDCGKHNSLQILDKNLEVVGKVLDLASTAPSELADRLIENALEDCVSSFDGFGREVCRVYANKSSNPEKAERMSFQNLVGVNRTVSSLFNLDLASGITGDEWQVAIRGFQKRHLLAHKMGVIDDEYVRNAYDPYAVVGRKVSVHVDEVSEIVRIVGKLALHLSTAMEAR